MKTLIFKVVVCLLLFLCVSWFSAENEKVIDKFVVVLDAGHGGHDSGNTGNRYLEKNISLKIILAIGKELEKNPEIKVIYTRKKDVFLGLKERAAIANKADADLFVSVHCNAHHSDAYGTETFVLGLHANARNFEIAKKENEVIFLEENYEENYAGFNPNAPETLIGLTLLQEEFLDQSILLASLIQDNFVNTLKRKNRSVKQAGFWLLHNTYMPSVLIETGFLTNKREGAYLNSKKGQQQMSRVISKAILSYKTSLNLSSSETETPSLITPAETEIYKGITFKVQLAASSKKMATKHYNFKGLNKISRSKSGKIYRYFYGATSDYTHIKNLKSEAKKTGYDTCFIVAFKNGKRIKLSAILDK